MVSSERQEDLVYQHNVLEVVDHTLAVQEIHGGSEEVPVESLGEAQAACSRRHIGNRNDLLVANNLHGGHDDEHVDVASEHGSKEEGNHDERPDGACDEGLLLLLVLRQLLDGNLLIVGRPASCGICAVLLGGSTVPRGALGTAVRAREAALFCRRVGHAATTHAAIAVLELDVLLGFGHGRGVVGVVGVVGDVVPERTIFWLVSGVLWASDGVRGGCWLSALVRKRGAPEGGVYDARLGAGRWHVGITRDVFGSEVDEGAICARV